LFDRNRIKALTRFVERKFTMSAEEKKENVFDVKAQVNKLTNGSKVAGIIVSIVLVIFGILLFIAPLRALIAYEYFAAVAMIIVGILGIFNFIKAPKSDRKAFTLVNAIITLVLGLILIFQGKLAVADTFAFLFGFAFMFSGMSKLFAIGSLKEAGQPVTWVVIGGILDIVTSIFFFTAPFISQWLFGIIIAIYMTIGGVSMFIDVCSR